MVVISNTIDIDSQQVLHSIGYDTDCDPPARIMSLVDEYVENICHLIEPSYSYNIKDIHSVQEPLVFMDGSIIFESEVVARLLEHCQKVAVFALTIGKRLEEMVGELAEDGLILQATVLDAIGSSVAETVADFVERMISESASTQGYCTSRRFSPGYCDWKLNQQKMVFRAMNGDSAGIRLTDKCLMLPRKSISGIIGIGPYNSNMANYNPCKSCKKQDCPGRR